MESALIQPGVSATEKKNLSMTFQGYPWPSQINLIGHLKDEKQKSIFKAPK